MPVSKAARILYLSLLIVTVLCIAFCIFVTVWANAGEEGWITKSAAMVFVWIASSPLILGSVIWTVALFSIRNSESRKLNYRK
jgi:membrane protein YdbS with pleckstrin-like domain